MLRLALVAAVALLAAVPQGAAQTARPVYDGLAPAATTTPGVRLGVGVGPSIYVGPDVLAGAALRDRVMATNLGVTAELTVPFTPQLFGRLQGGVLNLGAESSRPDVGTVVLDANGRRTFVEDASYNPYLTSETILAEAHLLYYLTPPVSSPVSPYVFSGLSGLFATGDAAEGIQRSALAVPVGLGLEARLSRNVSLFAEGSYRFGLTPVAVDLDTPDGFAGRDALGPDPGGPPSCEDEPTNPDCKPCEEDPLCPGVNNRGDASGQRRFGMGLISGGLRIGFNPPPPVYVPPVIPPPVAPPPVTPPPVVPPPRVCELVDLNTIYFDFGTATLTPHSRTLLSENVELLLANPACCVFIDSYLDHSELDRFGMPVGSRRAQAVYEYYLSRGVEAGRMQIRNRGVAEPNCDKEDPGPGCERNRRVESVPMDCARFQQLLGTPYGN